MQVEHPTIDIVSDLERLSVLYAKLQKEAQKLWPDEALDAAEACVLRWACCDEIEEAEARRRVGWSESLGSSKISGLQGRGLLTVGISSSDRRRHVLRAGPKAKEALFRLQEKYEQAFAQAVPELLPAAKELRQRLQRAVTIIERPECAAHTNLGKQIEGQTELPLRNFITDQ